MYAKKQTNIMRHKHWHTGGFIMRDKVAKAQAAMELKEKEQEVREKEREKEREIKYYQELQEKAGGEKRKERVDWMYEFGGARKKQEVGVEVISAEKIAEQSAAPPAAVPSLEQEKKSKKVLTIDLESKIREDPLMAMQAARMKALQEKLNDPMWALALNQKRAKMQAKVEKKEKQSKKSKKHKKEKKEKKSRKRRRSTSSSSYSSESTVTRRVKAIRREEESEWRQKNSYNRNDRKKQRLTDDEKSRRLRDMERDARDWEEERSTRIHRAREADRREEEANTTGGAAYMKDVNKQMMNQSLSDRVRSNKKYSEKFDSD